jgi:hypothetical protein
MQPRDIEIFNFGKRSKTARLKKFSKNGTRTELCLHYDGESVAVQADLISKSNLTKHWSANFPFGEAHDKIRDLFHASDALALEDFRWDQIAVFTRLSLRKLRIPSFLSGRIEADLQFVEALADSGEFFEHIRAVYWQQYGDQRAKNCNDDILAKEVLKDWSNLVSHINCLPCKSSGEAPAQSDTNVIALSAIRLFRLLAEQERRDGLSSHQKMAELSRRAGTTQR